MSASLASHNINTKHAENASASTRDIHKIRTRQICCRVAIAYDIAKSEASSDINADLNTDPNTDPNPNNNNLT
jgi:hypothetical protein